MLEHITVNKTDNKIIINKKKRQMKYQKQEEVKVLPGADYIMRV